MIETGTILDKIIRLNALCFNSFLLYTLRFLPEALCS